MTQHDDGHEPSFACWWQAARDGDANAMFVVAWDYGDVFDGADAGSVDVVAASLAGAEPAGLEAAPAPETLAGATRMQHAVYWAQRAATLGDARAARVLGDWLYRIGPPFAPALAWYARAAELGDGDAARTLGDRLAHPGSAGHADPQAARRWHRRARVLLEHALTRAEDGYARVRLGEMYLRGDGGRRDVARAIACWERAAESGYAWAMLRLADLYADGGHVEHDFERARHWWQAAAALGDREAARQLEHLPQRRQQAARAAAAKIPLAQLKRWAERGDVALFRPGSAEPRLAAVLALAEGSSFNLLGFVITRLEDARQRRAAWCLFEAEARHSPLAAMNLARRHELGWAGAKQDFGAALRWLRHAAQAGEPLAMVGLAERLQHPDYGTPDREQAAAWLRLAQHPRFVSQQRGVDATQLEARLAPPLAELEATLDAAALARVDALVAASADDPPRWPGG